MQEDRENPGGLVRYGCKNFRYAYVARSCTNCDARQCYSLTQTLLGRTDHSKDASSNGVPRDAMVSQITFWVGEQVSSLARHLCSSPPRGVPRELGWEAQFEVWMGF